MKFVLSLAIAFVLLVCGVAEARYKSYTKTKTKTYSSSSVDVVTAPPETTVYPSPSDPWLTDGVSTPVQPAAPAPVASAPAEVQGPVMYYYVKPPKRMKMRYYYPAPASKPPAATGICPNCGKPY